MSREKVLDAAFECSVDSRENHKVASVEKPTYVKQLRKIELDEIKVLEAVGEVTRSEASYRNWCQKGYVTEEDAKRYDAHLKYQHKTVFDLCQHDSTDEITRGQKTYLECVSRCLAFELSGTQPYAGYVAGALNRLANVPQIGWHPKWEEFFPPKEDGDDRS